MPPFENDDVVGLFATLDFDCEDMPDTGETGLPLTGVRVKAEAFDFIAEVKLSQCYKNNLSKAVEAIYHFPVDEAACVCDFKAEYEDGTTVKGVIKEKDQARKEYREAVRHGKQANLLESVRRDIFTLNVGNFPPGGHVKITITYITYLNADSNAAAFILPTCIAPRYSPGTEVSDLKETQALAPPHSDVKLFGLDIEATFKCMSAIKSITCPTHPNEGTFSTEIQGKDASVTLRDITMDRDLVLLVTEDKAHQPRASVEVSEDGSIAGIVTLFPKIEFQDVAREIIFVIDRSGSMSWTGGATGKTQIQQASDALLLFLRSLPSSCTFNIVGFGSHHESLFSHPMPFSDETLDEASRYARSMSSDFGGTEIMAPLKDVFKRKLNPAVERQVFVLTDGQVSNDLQVFDLIRNNCSSEKGGTAARCRLFALGIGAGVSRHLVNGMARAGHGTARFVEGGDEASLRRKVLGQLKQALQPALDDVSIQWSFASKRQSKRSGQSEQDSPPVKTLLGYRSPAADKTPAPIEYMVPLLCPSTTPPVFNEERFLSFALFHAGQKNVPESVTIKCKSPDGPIETTIEISDEEIFYGTIAHKMAARAAIREYEDERKGRGRFGNVASGDSDSCISKAEALRLALQNNLACELTSFIAAKERPVVVPGAEVSKQIIPQHLPSYNADISQPQERFRSVPCAARAMADLAPVQSVSYAGLTLESAKMSDPGLLPDFAVFRSAPRHFAAGVRRLARVQIKEEECGLDLDRSVKLDSVVPRKRGLGLLPDFSGLGSVARRGGSLFRRASKARNQPAASRSPPVAPTVPSPPVVSTGAAKPQEVEEMEDDSDYDKVPASIAQKQHKESASTDAKLMQLCLLQAANGSFSLTENLAMSVGQTLESVKHLAAETQAPNSKPPLDGSVFATLLAVAAMRKIFAAQKEIWLLQERKALDYVRKQSGLSDADINVVVSTLQSAL